MRSRGEPLGPAGVVVDIGVMVTGDLSVRATDLLARRVARDAQLRVVVDLAAQSSPAIAVASPAWQSLPSMGPAGDATA